MRIAHLSVYVETAAGDCQPLISV